MSDARPISFTRQELLSYLPSGWGLAREDDLGDFDPAKGRWRVEVRDPAEQVWPIDIESSAANELGRIAALRRAVDRLYREALG